MGIETFYLVTILIYWYFLLRGWLGFRFNNRFGFGLRFHFRLGL